MSTDLSDVSVLPLRGVDRDARNKTAEHTYECKVFICAEEAGGYSIIAARLPGAASQGETVEKAIESFKEAFQGLVECYRDEGREIPWLDEEAETPQGAIEKWILVDA